MTARAIYRPNLRRAAENFLMLPFASLLAPAVAAGIFVSYALWPTWKNTRIPFGAPEIPITVAGVLFNVPPAAIRTPLQRQPGPHERIDLVFLWPSLAPPQLEAEKPAQAPFALEDNAAAAPSDASPRLFVTIDGLGSVMAPKERLQTVYPHYVAAQATAGPDGLAILPFRARTPYDGEDLVYLAADPDQFFARCTRQLGVVPGTCMQERAIEAAEVTLRFPRAWLVDWRQIAAGFDRLVATLHPSNG
jgi:hypothetical protein